MNWKQWIGKLTPWALAATAAFLKEVMGMEIGWWPTLATLVAGVVQFVVSRIK